MARINVEDEWFLDPRRGRLIRLMGNEYAADGLMLAAWRMSMRYWVKKELVPLHAWEGAEFPEHLVTCGLAEIRPEGVYVRGAERHFAWYHSLSQSKSDAGKKSAESRRKKYGTAQPSVPESPQKPSNRPEQTSNRPRTAPNRPERSSSSSPSSSSSCSEEKNKNIQNRPSGQSQAPARVDQSLMPQEQELPGLPLPKPRPPRFDELTRAKMAAFFTAYAEAYREKYKSPPEGMRDKALVGKVGHWIESVSESRAVQLVQVYLQIDHRMINDSCHDLWHFFRHLNRIGNALTTGVDPGGIDWEYVFGRKEK